MSVMPRCKPDIALEGLCGACIKGNFDARPQPCNVFAVCRFACLLAAVGE